MRHDLRWARPLDQSYVTGWGDRPLENPYHRFWCHQANPKYPVPPPGILSGGPNTGFEDPTCSRLV